MSNYLFGHSTPVFEESYQTYRMKNNVVSDRFKLLGGDLNDPVFPRMRDVTLSRDPGAPINLTDEEEAEFWELEDFRDLQDQISAASKTEAIGLRVKLNHYH